MNTAVNQLLRELEENVKDQFKLQKAKLNTGTQNLNKRAIISDEIIGKNIRLARKTKGISQAELGEALGISFQQIQKYERGANRISASKLHMMSRLLKIPLESFFMSEEMS